MSRAAWTAVGLVAGAFAAGFLARSLSSFRAVVQTLDRQDADLTRQWIKDELKDELRRKLESL